MNTASRIICLALIYAAAAGPLRAAESPEKLVMQSREPFAEAQQLGKPPSASVPFSGDFSAAKKPALTAGTPVPCLQPYVPLPRQEKNSREPNYTAAGVLIVIGMLAAFAGMAGLALLAAPAAGAGALALVLGTGVSATTSVAASAAVAAGGLLVFGTCAVLAKLSLS